MHESTEHAMRNIGIDPATLPAPSVYEWPVPEAGQAQGVMANITLATVLLGSMATNAARIDELRQIGVATQAVDRAPWIVKLVLERGIAAIDIRATNESRETLRAGAGPEAATWVDLKAAGPVVISTSAGSAVAVADAKGLQVWRLSAPIVARAAAIHAPVRDWLRQTGSVDGWLQGEVDRRLAGGGPWANITAAALFVRFAEPSTPSAAADWVRTQLAGQPIEALAAPRRWVLQLQSAQTQTMQELARVEADRLELMVDDVSDAVMPEDGSWQEQWLEVCHGRDDLEGICVLLREIAPDETLLRRVEQLDRSGRVVRSILPRAFVPSDERTRRVSQATPGAWWSAG